MQHLHLIDIEQRRRGPQSAEVDVVDQESDRRIGRALILLQFAYAANLKVPRPRGVARPVEIGNERQHILEMLPARIVECLVGENRRAARQLARRDRPQCGGDDDFVECIGAVGGDRLGHTQPEKRDTQGTQSNHAPSAGTNRIRFNGFAGVRVYAAGVSGPRGHPSLKINV